MTYFSAEQLIRNRLTDKLTKIPSSSILVASDLVNVTESSQINPAVHVVYAGDNLGDERGDGLAQKVEQQWQVIVVSRNMKNNSKQQAITESGELVSEVLSALQGFTLSPSHSRLKRVQAGKPTYRKGFAYFSFQFQTGFVVKSLDIK